MNADCGLRNAEKHYALPLLRSPARRDEGWMRYAV
jgi:hypothetical protein